MLLIDCVDFVVFSVDFCVQNCELAFLLALGNLLTLLVLSLVRLVTFCTVTSELGKSKNAAAQKEKPSHIQTEGETLNIGHTHTHIAFTYY